MGNRILYSNVRAQTGPQLRGKIQFVVRHFEFVTVEFFVAHALWFFRLVAQSYVIVQHSSPGHISRVVMSRKACGSEEIFARNFCNLPATHRCAIADAMQEFDY